MESARMMREAPVTRSVVLGDLGDSMILAFVLFGLHEARSAGTIPADRPDPTGGEDCMLLMEDGKLIGFAVFYLPEGNDFVWLDLLWVAPGFRSRGGGRLLISSVLKRAAEWGVPTVRFGTAVDNPTMPIIAKMMGFEQHSVTYTRQVA